MLTSNDPAVGGPAMGPVGPFAEPCFGQAVIVHMGGKWPDAFTVNDVGPIAETCFWQAEIVHMGLIWPDAFTVNATLKISLT